MFALQYTGQFKKDLKRLKKRSQKNFKALEGFVENLTLTGFSGVHERYRPHKLTGNYVDCYECHVMNDLLLIWKEDAQDQILVLIRAGTHSVCFKSILQFVFYLRDTSRWRNPVPYYHIDNPLFDISITAFCLCHFICNH